MKRYYITYRGEFGLEVQAESEEKALSEILKHDKWTILSELHPDFLEIEPVEETRSKKEIDAKINDWYEELDEIEQHAVTTPLTLKAKARCLLEIANLMEQKSCQK